MLVCRQQAACTPHKTIHRIQAIVFTNQWIMAAKLARNAPALKRWCERFEHGYERQVDPLSRKYAGYLRGVMVEAYLRLLLCKRFVILIMVLGNPLWRVLRRLEGTARKLDQLAQDDRFDKGLRLRVKLENKVFHPLDRLAFYIREGKFPETGHPLKSMEQYANGDWRCLAILLAVHASRSVRYQAQRDWLSRHFTLAFMLICLQPELMGATRLMFQVVDHLIRQHVLAPVWAWPRSRSQFKRRLKQLREQVRKLQCRFGINQDDAIKVIHAAFMDWNPERAILTEPLRTSSSATPIRRSTVARILERDRRCRCKPDFWAFPGLGMEPALAQFSRFFH
ncbi:hypothetical protein PS712_03343 [Pseudomonas fluorescens]|uniref:Uncharacterized protein n=1 Tax=Pseudomonas fluorescens TaxID=294 RepID=A0A5E7DCE8_PSEFL|nr:hypothetical protein [Pseudomonas fluorescens]VVO09545.1 hypothetical protein PS712_03343 [Pseudomonas fluorescens]